MFYGKFLFCNLFCVLGKGMNKKRISYRLSVYILSIAVIVISVIVIINYTYSKRLLTERIEESAINQSKLIITNVARPIVTTQEITRNVANQALYYYQHNDLDFFLKQVLESNPSISGMHVLILPEFASEKLQAGHSTVRQNTQIITHRGTMPLFNFSQHCPGIVGKWTDPYHAEYSPNSALIAYCMPLAGSGETDTVGYVCCETELENINRLVSGIQIGKEGFAAIIDSKGLFLTHPNQEWVLSKNIYDLPDKVFPGDVNAFKNMLQAGKSIPGIIYPETFNYEKSWLYYAPMPYTQWTLIIIVPVKELFYDLWLVFRQIVSVALVGIIIIVLLFVWVVRKTLEPLLQVTKDIQSFSLGGKKTVQVNNEIVSLVESLEVMQNRYDELLKEQNQSKKDKRNIEKDLKSAKEIQSGIIPSGYPAFPDRPEIDIFAVLSPAQTIGGDLYDYFFIDKNHLLFAIGDVSGKGIPASLFMAVAHTLIKSNSNVLSSKHIVELMNKKLSQRNTNQHFITLFVGILDISTGILDYCNAAHNHPYLLRHSGELEMLSETHGLPAGIYANKSYSSSSNVLRKGDMIFLYTDGVIDCRNPEDQIFGQKRLESILEQMKGTACKELVHKIETNLKSFKGTNKQTDDISLMAIRFME